MFGEAFAGKAMLTLPDCHAWRTLCALMDAPFVFLFPHVPKPLVHKRSPAAGNMYITPVAKMAAAHACSHLTMSAK